MNSLRLSLAFLVVFGLAYVTCTNPITSLFGKRQDEKTEADDKAAATTTTTTAKPAAGETTTTANPSSSCGGLKGFLHICDKQEPTEPPKNVKARRNVPEEDSSSSSSSSEEDNLPGPANNYEKIPVTVVTVDEPTEAMKVKRQVEDTEEPPVVGQPLIPLEVPADAALKKRQVEESEESESTESDEEASRRRRDCRDRDGDYEKDCRK